MPISPAAEKARILVDSATRKAKYRLIPFLLVMYVFAYLDRANVGFAKEQLNIHVGISDAAFALGASLFFLPYILLEIPSNVLMHKVGARVWMCRIMVTWGLASAAMLFVQNETQFYILRAVLGACEAGFFPGAILFLSLWFPDRHRAGVTGLFYIATPLAFIFGSPISGLLLGIDGVGGLFGYQWMFLLEGLAASAVGVVALFVLKDGPAKAHWLDEDERTALAAELDAERQLKQEHSGARHALSALKHPTVLLFGALFATVQLLAAQITFYLPTQISELVGAGVGLEVGLLVAVPWTCALIATIVVPRYAARTGRMRSTAAIAGLTAAVGLFLSIHTPTLAAMIILCLAVAGLWALQPTFWTLLTNRVAGLAAVTGIAMVNSLGNIGNLVSPNIRTWADTSLGSGAGVAIISALAVVGALLFFVVKRSPAEELAGRDDVPSTAVAGERTTQTPV